ncbi:hypothetical protein [Streptomyces sp. NPDC049099]|uniref:hypothetical protein n=1 Tax=unclassified Streptomyces TaxID=2593676 RepID=UPI0034238160
MARKRRTAASFAAVSMLALAATTLGTGTASAAPTFTFKCVHLTSPSEWETVAYNQDGHYVGLALFDQDPYGGSPGDALYATDAESDGFWVEAHLSTGRVASTKGHTAGYTAGPVTGDLPEDHTYYLSIEMHNSEWIYSSQGCTAKS